MPIIVPEKLPANLLLKAEQIAVVDETQPEAENGSALNIAILNLMPTKLTTEAQLLRLLGNSPLWVRVTWLRPASHKSKNTPEEHLLAFYKTFEQVSQQAFDALIITGAPVENLPFEEVDYWPELTQIIDWGVSQVPSLFYICWGAQAALYHQFGIKKYPLPAKKFGVFTHQINYKQSKLLHSFDDEFYAPHSRHTEIRREDIEQVPELEILSESKEAGVYIVATRDERQFFVTGHSEYDPLTLKAEYDRDVAAHLPITLPVNYFPNDDATQAPVVRWRSHAALLFANWLHYYVYPHAVQHTLF